MENAAGHVTLRQNPVRFERSKKKTPQKPIQVTSIAGLFEIKTATFEKVMCKLRGNYDHDAE